MAEPLAEAYVRVRPETSGFKEELRRGIEDSGAGEQGSKQGDLFGGKFSQQARKNLYDAFKSLPNIKVNADSTDADLKVAAIRSELKALRNERIGITIDEGLAMAQVARIRAELAALGAGSSSASFKVDTHQAARDLGQIEGMTKRVTGSLVSDFTKAGSDGATGFMGALQATWPAVIPAAAVLGAEVTAAVGGGALALAGGGALATGIALQLQSPRVHAAVTDLGSFVKGQLTDATDVFNKPLMAGLSDLKAALGPALGDLRPAFKELAPYVELFGRELGQAAKVAGPLFAGALKDAGPVLGVIAHELPTVARGFGDFFAQVGHGAKGGAEALDALIKGASVGLSALGYVIRGAENAWDFFIQTLDKGTGLEAKIFGWVPGLGGKINDLHDYVHGTATSFNDGKISASAFSDSLGFGGLTGQALGAAGALGVLDKATLQWKNDALDSRDATLAFKDGLANLKDQMSKNGAGFNENTTAGRKNVEALNDLATSAQAVADKTYAATGNSQAAAQAYQQARDQVLELARQGHASAAEIAALNDALDSAIKVRKGTVDIEVNLTGSGKALVTNQGTTRLSGGLVGLRAAGGDVWPGQKFLVGEQGPEIVEFGQHGYVTPNNQLPASLGGTAPAGGRSASPMAMPAPVVNVQVLIDGEEVNARARVVVQQELAGVAGSVGGWRM